MGSSEQISAVAEEVINEFVKAMEKDGDSEEGLKKAFQVLSKDQNSAPVSADVLCRVMQNRGVTLTIGEVEETIRQVKAKTKDEGQINYEEFIKIMKLLKEPTVVDQLTKIYRYLDKEEAIVLYGESGVGKTWMARKIADHAIRRRKFDFALWIYLNRIYEGLSLQESIAYQLSILSASDESEAKEGKKEELEQDKAKQGKLEKMKEKEKQEKVESMIHAAMKGKSLLLILDDEGSKMKIHVALEEKKLLLILNDEGSEGEKDKPEVINLYQLLALDQLKSWKFLITSRNRATSGEIGVMVMPLIQDESKSLVLQKMVGVDKLDEIKDLADFFIGKSRRLPAEVLIIAKTMSYFGRSEQGLQKLQSFKEILEEEESVKMEQAHDINEYCNVTQLLISGYERLPRSVLIDCYSSETPLRHFLHQRGMVNFNELISYWIMEGHLGHRIEDAYEEGHRVLMDLVDCGLLKKLEAGYVMSSGAKFNLDIHDCYKFFESIHLGLATTFDNKLGAIGLADGMIRTIGSGQEGKKLLTLLLDGNHTGEIPDGLFESESELEILAIFNPTRKHFPLPIFKMQKLRLLVLRGCEFLESIEKFFQLRNPENPKVPEESQSLPPTRISDPSPSRSPGLVTPNILLQKLTVFEISGPSSLKTIPDNFFKNMPHLKNLNLSFLQIELLPASFYHLTKLEFLILRGCSSLQGLGTLKNFKDLQVLDISGATSVANILDKSFSGNKKLQILNLSRSRIERLPLIHSLENLKSLSLRDCAVLLRIRKSGSLKRLQILDISGATKVEEFLDPSLEGLQSIVVLDVSRTAIRRLPSNIGNPRYLYLSGCSRLKELPPIEGLSKVEVLDLSGSCHLEEIRNEFFKNTKCLRELNLSKTSVKRLPFLSCLGNLRRLLLSQCLSLEKLENLSSLEELEVLDLSGCKALMEIEDKSFDKMNRLHSLDLSGIQLDQLPSMSKLLKLKKLSVKDCPKLTNVSGLEELPALEILDHSGTTLKPSPSFHPDCNPVVIGPISLSIENIDPLQLLKSLGASNDEVTSDKSESTRLQHEQPNMDTQGDGAEKSNLPQEGLDQCNWSISNWQGEANVDEETLGVPVNGIHFLQLLNMHPSLLTKNFSRFHFLVYPTEAQTELPDKFSYRNELSLRDTYLGQVSQQKLERCLEIRGFVNFPPCLGHLLKQAEFVVLIDNPFFRFLLNLGVDSIKVMKACWIERCNELEHVIGSEEVEDTGKPGESAKTKGNLGKNAADNLKNLEILWVSDATKLRGISSGDIQSISFKSLKSLYMEYCPQLSMICSSSLQLESLEILYIKYCQKLGTLFTDDSAKLEKLTALHLWGLPELKKIASKVQSLRTLRVGECPMLEHVISSTPGHEHDEVEGHEKLEILQIKFCDKLKTIFESQHEDVSARFPELEELELCGLPELQKIAFTAPSLDILRVGECPLLEIVVDSVGLPKNLKFLEVKSCDKLKTIIQGGESELPKVDKMDLLCLPELKSIGAHLPKQENCIIGGCPKLQIPLLGDVHMEYSQIPETNDGRNQ